MASLAPDSSSDVLRQAYRALVGTHGLTATPAAAEEPGAAVSSPAATAAVAMGGVADCSQEQPDGKSSAIVAGDTDSPDGPAAQHDGAHAGLQPSPEGAAVPPV